VQIAALQGSRRSLAATRGGTRVAAALPLAVVVGIGAALRLIAFPRVRLDPFYDAAVRSMGTSWHNLFYGVYEPAGQVSVDKIPVDLWLQVASTKLFGFTSVALRIPEVVAGILAIVVLHDLVRRLFGSRAAILAAAALAVLPISVVTARSDTMDSLMMLCIVAAAWLVVRASQTGRTAPLVGAGAMLGLAFEVKLFEALIALPALLVLALALGAGTWRRRVAQLAAAGGAFAGVSLSWLVAVSLSPAAQRPFAIGSTNGSAWNVVFAFNGIDRIRTRPTAAQALLDPAGIARLFTNGGVQYGRLIGSALIAALALGAAALATLAAAHIRGRAPGSARSAEQRRRRAGAVFLAVWLLLGCALFSAMGRLHPRYLEAFTPAVAATIGVSLAWLTERAQREGAARWLLIAAVTATAVLAPAVAVHTWAGAGVVAAAAAVATASLALADQRPSGHPQTALLAIVAAVALLAVPAASALHLATLGASSSGRPGAAPKAQVAALSRYLIGHQGSARYETASSAVAKAGPLIARDGRPVLMLTSLYHRPLLSAAQLAADVARHEVRYALLAPCPGAGSTCPAVLRWARRHGVDVSRAARQPARTLYRLATSPTVAAQHRRHASQRRRPAARPLARTATAPPRTPKPSSATSAIDRMTRVAERRYTFEQRGPVVRELLRRVAADPALRAAARAGDDAALRAAVARRFDSAWYHWHVSRLLIVRHRRTVVDVGVPFVIAPSARPLRDARGHTVASLEISDQDLIGFVRFMHRNHGVDVVARGAGASHVRTSLPAAQRVRLPDRGERTIAGRRYRVRAFTRRALHGERVRIWILLRVGAPQALH
jgi:4-amino-4-deoxy-L-arabinose transferase-like glycosyltransferase